MYGDEFKLVLDSSTIKKTLCSWGMKTIVILLFLFEFLKLLRRNGKFIINIFELKVRLIRRLDDFLVALAHVI